MSTFEFTFGLVSLLLGLGFAHIAQSFARLVVAGRRVQWDWLSPLAALNVFQLALIYWWYQYGVRDEEVVMGTMALNAAACLMLYMMAVAAFPDIERDDETKLRDHFAQSRGLYYVCWTAYQILVAAVPQIIALANGQPLPWPIWLVASNLAPVILGLFVANRWVQTALLLLAVIGSAYTWLPQALS